jgi:hypothetical protein
VNYIRVRIKVKKHSLQSSIVRNVVLSSNLTFFPFVSITIITPYNTTAFPKFTAFPPSLNQTVVHMHSIAHKIEEGFSNQKKENEKRGEKETTILNTYYNYLSIIVF